MTPESGNVAGLVPLVGAVELGAVDERALVVHLDGVGRLRLLAGARRELLIDHAGLGLLGALLLGGLLEELGALLLLRLAGRLHARLGDLADLRPELLGVGLRRLVLERVGQAGGDHLDLFRRQRLQLHELLRDADAERVERLLVVGLGVRRAGGEGEEQEERKRAEGSHRAGLAAIGLGVQGRPYELPDVTDTQRATLAVVGLAIAVVLWGLNTVAIKLIAPGGLVVAVYRLWFAIPLLWATALAPSVRRRLDGAWLRASIVGGVLFSVHQVLFFTSLKLTTSRTSRSSGRCSRRSSCWSPAGCSASA
jgi:hypothetical protein